MRSVFQLKTYISFISFKTRGRKDSIKWKAVFLFKDQQKKTCVTRQIKMDIWFPVFWIFSTSILINIYLWVQQWTKKYFFASDINCNKGTVDRIHHWLCDDTTRWFLISLWWDFINNKRISKRCRMGFKWFAWHKSKPSWMNLLSVFSNL